MQSTEFTTCKSKAQRLTNLLQWCENLFDKTYKQKILTKILRVQNLQKFFQMVKKILLIMVRL